MTLPPPAPRRRRGISLSAWCRRTVASLRNLQSRVDRLEDLLERDSSSSRRLVVQLLSNSGAVLSTLDLQSPGCHEFLFRIENAGIADRVTIVRGESVIWSTMIRRPRWVDRGHVVRVVSAIFDSEECPW